MVSKMTPISNPRERSLVDVERSVVNQTSSATNYWIEVGWKTNLSDAIWRARYEAGISQSELAERLGTTQSEISKIERGKDIKLSRYVQIMVALGKVPTVPEFIPLDVAVRAVKENPRVPLTREGLWPESLLPQEQPDATEANLAPDPPAPADPSKINPRPKRKRAA